MLQYNPTVSGSLSVTGTITATQGITGSFSGSVAGFPTDVSAFSASLSTRITATESTSSEYVTTSSSLASRVSSNEARTGSFATTGSNQFNGNQFVTGSLTATGTIVAQTLVVQTITSSVEYVSGSNRFGSTTGNTHEFTGSVLVSGSGYISGNVGIGVTDPSYKLDVRGDVNGDVTLARFQNRDGNGNTGAYIGFSTGYAAMATIGAKREGAENDSSLVFSPMLNENAVERMRITSGGSVGIGTTSPSSARADRTLHLYGSYPGLTIESTGVARKWNLTANYYDSTAALEVWDQTAGGVHTVFQAGGRVGIGLTNPAKKLDVYDSNGNATAQIKLRNSGTTAAAYLGAFSGHTYLSAGGTYDSGWTTDGTNGIANIVMETTNGGSAIAFGTAASNVAPTERMRILGGGDVGIGKTNPSYKLDVSGDIRATNELKSDYRLTLPGMTIGYWDTANNRIESGTRPLFITAYSQPIKFGPDGTETLRIETTGEIIHSYTNSFFTQRGGGGYSIMRLYGNSNAVELQMAAHQTSGMGSIGTYTSSALMFKTSNTERMRIMSGGGIGTGQSANSTPLRATLVKTGTTSITFNMSMNTIGAWRPGFATVRVSGAQNGLQEYWMAWYIIRLTGYFGSGLGTAIISSGGDTGAVSLTSSSDTNSPQAFSITVTDSGGTTNTMIADLDVAYHEGIISLT